MDDRHCCPGASGKPSFSLLFQSENTDEMIRMADLLRSQYADHQKIHLSWDSASWHFSKKLSSHLDEINRNAAGKYPVVELAPLPAGAQFLNIIESVFSGMARAIIHNSDYPSVETPMFAIDRYFDMRNLHTQADPSRAGRKIWQMERERPEFSETDNCKDPTYR
jgi:hypothetical protein